MAEFRYHVYAPELEDTRRGRKLKRAVDSYYASYPDADRWNIEHGVHPSWFPRFAEGSHAIHAICHRCGIKHFEMANECGVAPNTLSGWGHEPEWVAPESVRQMLDLAGRCWDGTPDEFKAFIDPLLDNPFREVVDPFENPDDIASIEDIDEVWLELTPAQQEAILETVRAMVAANRSCTDL